MKKFFSKGNFIMFVKFGCVGVINTVIDYGVFFLLCDLLGVNEIVSNVIAYLVSATNSYVLNSSKVYKESRLTFKRYFEFLAGNISVLIISSIGIAALSRFFSVKTVAKLISAPITILLNFIVQRYIVFKKSADKIAEND